MVDIITSKECICPKDISDRLVKRFGYSNLLSVPKLSKIVVSMGVGKAVSDKSAIADAVRSLEAVSGRKAVVTTAKKSISSFKLRQGMPIGCRVTLRKDFMYDFIFRFLYVALPRSRDFRGFSVKQFDGKGNFSCGINDITIFHEIEIDKVVNAMGLNVSVVTTAQSDEEGRVLLDMLGFPFFDNV